MRIREEDKAEFIGQIIDIFEDFLDDTGVVIPDDERDLEEDPESHVNIYGRNYDLLSGQIEKTLKRWKLCK